MNEVMLLLVMNIIVSNEWSNIIVSNEWSNSNTEYITDDMLPLSTVESPAFRKLVCRLLSSSVQYVELPNRKSISLYLQNAYELMVKKIKEVLEGVSQVSTTADIWTAHHKSYLGMTIH